MRRWVIVIAAGFLVSACSSTGASFLPQGYSASAWITAGRLDFKDPLPTLDACAEAVRNATKIPDPSHLGRIAQDPGVNRGDALGICGGPDGRMYLVGLTEIRPGPTIIFER